METQAFYRSKTFWVNFLGALITIFEASEFTDLIADRYMPIVVLVVFVLNVLLRTYAGNSGPVAPLGITGRTWTGRRKFAILVPLFLALSTSIAFAQAPVIGPNDAIGFDYRDVEFAEYVVTRFEASYDSGPWNSINVPPIAIVVNGVSTYRVIPPQPTGTHTVVFRACNAVGCSTSTAPFDFAVLGAPATAPGNVRRIPR